MDTEESYKIHLEKRIIITKKRKVKKSMNIKREEQYAIIDKQR